MKISYNWLQDYINLDKYEAEQIGDILTAIGLEVEGMETVESVPGGLRGLVVGKVLSCEKHPNADKLSLTTVDVGADDPLQIVCGAPNVAAGKYVIVATVGTTLHPIEGESFKIKKGKIRGEVSEGMICAEDEIGTGRSHDGIIVLKDEVKPGTSAAEHYNIKSDIVFDIGLTPNRSDAGSHRGVVRDLLAYLRVNHDHSEPLPQPSLANIVRDDLDASPVSVLIKDEAACPRYSGLCMDVTVGESPEWLKTRLNAIGIRPKNNVVDITNFILHDLGQPLHAFDADKLNGGIIVQTLTEGAKLVTLDEVERKMKADDLIICDAKNNPLAIAGVFGGVGSGVTAQTQRIFIESAHFNSKWVRRTSMRHNLRTDAAKIYEKGSDPNITVLALQRAAALLVECADGKITSGVIDVYPKPIQPVQVSLRFRNVSQLIGCVIPRPDLLKILDSLEMRRLEEDGDGMLLEIPTDKADVLREVDVIEEVLRIYGLDNVPLPANMRITRQPKPTRPKHELQNRITNLLVSNGFYEAMSLSLNEREVYEKWIQKAENELILINNTSNVQFNTMRADMVVSALENIRYNSNRQQTDLRFFEFGNSYGRRDGEMIENSHLTLALTGSKHIESWHNKNSPVSYFTLKSYVDLVFQQLGVIKRQESEADEDDKFSYAFRYHRGPKILATFGKLSNPLLKNAGLKQDVFYADINWDELSKAGQKQSVSVAEPDKYPAVRRDLALIVSSNTKFREVVAIAQKAEKKLLRDINLFDVYENAEQLGENRKSYAVSFTFVHPEKTMTDKEVDKIMQKMIGQYERQLGAEIRK